jgi:hypothetical protein
LILWLYLITVGTIKIERKRYSKCGFLGEWEKYDYSQVVILDGLTGETIWSKSNSYGEFTSPLSLQMRKNGRYQDGFIYRQRGQINSNTSSILFHGIGLQDGEISK